jgi:hypothetical protein
MPFTVTGWASGFSRVGPPGHTLKLPRNPLVGFGSSSEDAQAPSRCTDPRFPTDPTPGKPVALRSASPEVLPPSAFSPRGAAAFWSDLPCPTACAFRCSQPPGASIRSEPAGLVPCRIRSWGHPPEPSSSRAAVRCSQRRSPLDVRNAFRVLLHARVRHPVQLFKLKPSA